MSYRTTGGAVYDGKPLHSQDAGELQSGDHHDRDKVFDFLKKWAPKKDSEELR